MSIINQSVITNYFDLIEQELYALVPSKDWVIKPKSWRLSQAKTKYGMADAEGVIHINHNFLRTHFHQLLNAVLRHEFAHLCIGLQHGHNKRFKQCERLFDARFNVTAKQQAREFGKLISYKYLLQAELISGEMITLKKVHRRHRNYLNYQYSRYKTYFYRHQPIKRFKYINIA